VAAVQSAPLFSRTQALGLSARASEADLIRLAQAHLPDWQDLLASGVWLRAPELGLMHVQARADGDGAPFFFHEITITRASLRMPDGRTGHAMVLGRSQTACQIVALFDACAKDADWAQTHGSVWVAELQEAENTKRASREAEAELSRVDFFTLARESGD